MNKMAVGPINSTDTVPLQCCLSHCSAKRVKWKKKKKKKRVKTQTQQSSVLSKRHLYILDFFFENECILDLDPLI